MRVYFSGISGTGIGPLAMFAKQAGLTVFGSDLARGAIASELNDLGIEVFYGEQDGAFLRKCLDEGGVDWFVYSSALPEDHAELKLARELGLRASKRDEFLAELIAQKGLKMIAVAGTHGKTTTTAMFIWVLRELGLVPSYLVGTTLGWAPSGYFSAESRYFVYEADEYDRNFLAFHPHISAITSVDYDHPDIYPSAADYMGAFSQFEAQSENVVKNTTPVEGVSLVGELRREDASLVFWSLVRLRELDESLQYSDEQIIEVLNRFPGAGRRFEEIFENVISDYGHHPREIRATLAMARELAEQRSLSGVAAIYQPHQNTRQYKIFDEYFEVFEQADKIFWVPTFLVREDPELRVIEPSEFAASLKNADDAEAVELDEAFAERLRALQKQGWLVILLTAGPADGWLREVFLA